MPAMGGRWRSYANSLASQRSSHLVQQLADLERFEQHVHARRNYFGFLWGSGARLRN
ncbi:hypothetical protein [Pseudomonas sp. Irchel 3E13]|uniref:hypothetical protein n=1 Tax=Pseudomonas sp. Irchel 3E13 TaxID=2008975 RepID=UPI00135A7844|nr:hypothetical protein [Pseudomonas sp. Irchel 3E13]